MSKGKAFIIKKNSTNICYGKKMVINGGKGCLLTTNFYNSANHAALLEPNI